MQLNVDSLHKPGTNFFLFNEWFYGIQDGFF